MEQFAAYCASLPSAAERIHVGAAATAIAVTCLLHNVSVVVAAAVANCYSEMQFNLKIASI